METHAETCQDDAPSCQWCNGMGELCERPCHYCGGTGLECEAYDADREERSAEGDDQ